MDNLWKKYAGDFNSMTDDEVDDTVSDEHEKLKEAQEWLEAVASWKAAGKPRRTPMNKYIPPRVETKEDYSQTLKALRVIEMLERAHMRTQPQPHNWTGSVFIALIIMALLMLGLSLDVQATVDAVNMEMTNETD